MRRAAALAGVGIVLLAGVLLLRTAALPSRQVAASPIPPVDVGAQAVAQRLALAVRHRTVSYRDRAKLDAREFEQLHSFLRAAYPKAHAALEREKVGALSLLYTWPGRNPDLRPVLLAAHQDVAAVDPGSEAEWTHPPFAGAVAGGFVWGRGTLNDKASLICLLEAVERLARQGFQPERTLYLAFGHDGELGGEEGAKRIASLLASRGVVLEWVIDEGGVIAADLFPGLETEVALVGLAEKGSLSISLKLEAAGGHSSTPPRHGAIGGLASAIVALEGSPMPARIGGVTALFLDSLAPELPFPVRIVLANRWLFGALLEPRLSRIPTLDAMLRTTTAVTIFEAGVEEDLLPRRARAVANFRIHPNDTIDTVIAHLRRTIRDNRIRLHVEVGSPPRSPSPTSPVDAEAFVSLQRTIRELFPGVAVVPYLALRGTDARHYYAVSENVYRFLPYVLGPGALELAHRVDERISVENLGGAVRFYLRLIQQAAAPEADVGRSAESGAPG